MANGNAISVGWLAVYCQNEPFIDIVDNLSAIIRSQFPTVKNALMGWPLPVWLQVEKNNLPAVFFVDISETGEHAVSQYLTHRTVKNSDGTGQIIKEKLRLHTLMQMTLFAPDKLTRDQLGWQIKQYFVTNYHIPLLDYTQATPAPTGEYMLLKFHGDHKEAEGEPNCWQRDLTLEVQSRVLDAVPAWAVRKITAAETFNRTSSTAAPSSPSQNYTVSEADSKDSSGNPVTTITITKK